jgi:phage FluMu protein Com
MKETAVTMQVHKCDSCNYRSLQKPPVATHIKAKCPGAKIVSETKIVRHRDIDYDCDDIATLHQCSKCEYTSFQSTSIKRHIDTKCPGATMLSEKRKLQFEDVPPVSTTTMTVDSNSGIALQNCNGNVNQTNLMLVIVANSKEEFDERLKIFYKVSRENGVEFVKGDFVPSTILDAFDKENPRLDNVKYTNNSVVCLKTGDKTPIVQYSSQELLHLFDIMLDILKKNEKCDANGDEYSEEFINDISDLCLNDNYLYHTRKRGDFETFKTTVSKDLLKITNIHDKTVHSNLYKMIHDKANECPLSSLRCREDRYKKPQKIVSRKSMNMFTMTPYRIPENQQRWESYVDAKNKWDADIQVTRAMISDIVKYYKTKNIKNN